MDHGGRRKQLAEFLRASRERLQPTDVGLPGRKNHRRTKGLRREEVAEIAEISVTWYTWVEQARDIRLSERALAQLAQALRLSPDQKQYLFTLAMPELVLSPPREEETISPQLRRILDSQDPIPAYVVGRRWDYLAWNRAADEVFFMGQIESIPRDMLNAVRLMFSPPARQLLVDWERHALRVLAEFRADSSRFVGEAWFTKLVDDLMTSDPEFRAWWPRHDVRWVPDWRKEVRHPVLGRLVLEQATFLADYNPGMRLVLYTPVPGTGTEEKLQNLAANRSVPV